MSKKNIFYSPKRKNSPSRNSEGLSLKSTPQKLYRKRVTEFEKTPDCFSKVVNDSSLTKSKSLTKSADVLNTFGKTDLGSSDFENEHSDRSTIRVGVRVRPFTQRELLDPNLKCVVSMEGNETVVLTEKAENQRFTYDYSFSSFDPLDNHYSSQEMVYKKLARPLLHMVLQGYNACLFAYGQTGSGKSYSIMGHGKDAGIVPRFCEELFEKVSGEEDDTVDYNIEISYYEIYNEKIHDLLASSLNKDNLHKKPHLRVREHPSMGPFVDGLSTYIVKTFSDVEGWLNVGNKRRATAATAVNDNSSRSHSVFTMIITKTMSSLIEGNTHKHNITSKINLVDLAGSERQSQAKTEGNRLREGACINNALMALGKVINVLSEQSAGNKKIFIPYRENVLTWLLKESLGGNSKTCMLATISPSSANLEETLSTLRYARQARNILNVARINEDSKASLIRRLQMELEKYKNSVSPNDPRLLAELQQLRQEIVHKELEKNHINKCWLERLKQSEACKLEEARSLERAGISSTMHQHTTCLVNLNRDPQLNEVLFYPLKMGVTRLGREGGDKNDDDGGGGGGSTCHDEGYMVKKSGVDEKVVGSSKWIDKNEDFHVDIQLAGALIARRHCLFEHSEDGSIYITSLPTASSYINGTLLQNLKSYKLQHGDRVVLGGDHFFRLVDPSKQQCDNNTGAQLNDFHAVYQEFTTKQNARLEAELNLTREAHEEKMKRMQQNNKFEQEELRLLLMQSEKKTNKLETDYQNKVASLCNLVGSQDIDYNKALCHIEELKNELKTLETKCQKAHASKKRIEEHLEILLGGTKHTHEELQTYKYESDILTFFGELKRKACESAGGEIGRDGDGVGVDNDGGKDRQIILLLHEANTISEKYKKDVEYTREDDKDGGVVVRVNRRCLSVSSFWSVHKFKNRLQQMRDLCQGINNDQNCDDIFYDNNDQWQDDSRMTVNVQLQQKHIRRSISNNSFKDNNLDLTLDVSDLSFNDSIIFPATTNKNFFNNAPKNTDKNSNISITTKNTMPPTKYCHILNTTMDTIREEPVKANTQQNNLQSFKTFLNLALTQFKSLSSTENFSNVIMRALNDLDSSLQLLKKRYDDNSEITSTTYPLFSLVHAFNTLQSCVSHWLMSLYDSQLSTVIESKNKFEYCIASIGTQLQYFIQGIEQRLDSLTNDSFKTATSLLTDIASSTGKMALVCQLDTNCLQSITLLCTDEGVRRLSENLKSHFIIGCNVMLHETLNEAIDTLHKHHSQAQQLFNTVISLSNINNSMSEFLKATLYAVSSAYLLLNNLHELQNQLSTSDDLYYKNQQNKVASKEDTNRHSFNGHPTNNHQHHTNFSNNSYFSYFSNDVNHRDQPIHSGHHHHTRRSSNDSDFYWRAYMRCRGMCTELSGVVDCSLQLVQMMTRVVQDDKVTVNSGNLRSLLGILMQHVDTLYATQPTINSSEGKNKENCNVAGVYNGGNKSIPDKTRSRSQTEDRNNINERGFFNNEDLNASDCNYINYHDNDKRTNDKYSTEVRRESSINNVSVLDGLLSSKQEGLMSEAVERMHNAISNLSYIILQ